MDLAASLEVTIKRYINSSPSNSLKNKESEKAFGDPLIGFSSGDDPLYKFFKKDIGSFYWEPIEIFSRTFPELKVRPDQLTIISWILPLANKVKSDNKKRTVYPSERWARVRVYGEEANDKLRRCMIKTIKDLGYEAVAPVLSPFWKWKKSNHYGFSSPWSERHAAYVSGLGTFGLCDALITPSGKAMRCGSVIANMKILPTKRPYKDFHAYCLFFSKQVCGKCIHRCPTAAITEKGHNKAKCEKYLQRTKQYIKSNFGLEIYSCGLCQTGVPCESKIPVENDIK